MITIFLLPQTRTKMSLKELFDHISSDDLESAKTLLAGGQVKVNDADEHGMSALQHASFKGLPKMCQMLLDQVWVGQGVTDFNNHISST